MERPWGRGVDNCKGQASIVSNSKCLVWLQRFCELWDDLHQARKVDVRLPGKGDSNSHSARPFHLIITMIKWIRTSRLSINHSLSCRVKDAHFTKQGPESGPFSFQKSISLRIQRILKKCLTFVPSSLGSGRGLPCFAPETFHQPSPLRYYLHAYS